MDYYSQAKFKIDVAVKSHNGEAFQRIAVMNGIHKLHYPCRIWTDGCGSMVHVHEAACRLGIDHAYIPPRDPSLNEAEKVCNSMWAAARAHLGTSQAPSYLMAEAVSYSMYMDMRTATTASRGWKTPHELIKKVKPTLNLLHRWYTKSLVNVPVSKRKYLENRGVLDRAEPGRLIGWHSPFSTTYKVMLSKNRVVHSRNVTFIESDYVQLTPTDIRKGVGGRVPIPTADGKTQQPDCAAQGGADGEDVVDIEHCDLFDLCKRAEADDNLSEYFEWTPGRE
jgi:hypothetical protein